MRLYGDSLEAAGSLVVVTIKVSVEDWGSSEVSQELMTVIFFEFRIVYISFRIVWGEACDPEGEPHPTRAWRLNG